MGVIRTDQWMEKNFELPVNICKKLRPYFKSRKEVDIYHELSKFGMYRPSWQSKKYLDKMLEGDVWKKVEQLFYKYKEKWSGPDIPVFLFPMERKAGLFTRKEDRRKAGVSYPDKMFLFLSHYDDPKEVEALLVHEYHHVCRLRALNKKMEDYTLLDSIIIEGLAEYAVLKHCGANYLANWCNMYSEREHEIFWERFLKPHLAKKKNERIHDELLYGGGRYPELLGYSAGYNIIEKFYEKHRYSTGLSFAIPASEFVK
ncbi:DUF2268 domain-containing protein [Bacillus sp. FJAT-29814]|uniref:DUF2268 domain-containing protein n=1 Tax=Bacillus sp. FJAT-29814 TaxID=1729688 RepID=UPI00082E1AF9|nr:DUF2268 domain-containing protein [Bacillus sp. FJAT-29814]